MGITETLFSNWHLVVSFFVIAILYSSVGFGGGSSYLAVLALTSWAYPEIRATALLCNIMVVSNSFYIYYKNGYYNFKKVIPLVITSIPLAFIGGYLKISETIFYILLGFTLLIAAVLMLINKSESFPKPESKTLKSLSYGGFIGFISGMVGIGGGIFLAPLLHLTNWDTSKKIAATASLFILVNSISGLSGQILNPEFHINTTSTLILLATTFIGGQIGTRISIQLINPILLKRATALLIAFVAIKLLVNQF
ncbi:sulfite exporter TauE/SafE family protein [Flavicella sediminum]|uniref:sulfite exporter TauE/SafE family protein n=1 Tax=Flavicella sediminum TaxID=2585141 RepID=UPI00111F6AC2|nr:sulfite exporter TauE/SafE family protein [Flavicella sediminum]